MKTLLSLPSCFLAIALLTPSPAPAVEAAKPKIDTARAVARIDAALARHWKAQKITPNEKISEEVFVRRAYLTVVGRIPTHDEAQRFLTWQAPDKNARLIDQLLASDGYVQHFTNYWADILRAKSTGIGGNTTAQAYLDFIRDSLRRNKPYNQFVKELVTATGECYDNGAVGYYMRDQGMALDNLSNTVRIFLGTRLECAQCHDHPFDKWTQMEFYEMAAFTHNMTGTSYSSDALTAMQKAVKADKSIDKESQDLIRKAVSEATRPLRSTRVVERSNSMKLPHDYKYTNAKPKDVVPASVMFGKPVELKKGDDPILEFGKWLTGPENPRFASVIVNRLWKQTFGLALIEPFDELMDNSVAVVPELQTLLEKQMIDSGYDMKAFLRVLLNTDLFTRASTKADLEPGTPYHFPGPVFRRMSAEQIWDSLVTLVSTQPDQPNWTLRETERRNRENRKLLDQILDATSPDLLKSASLKVADHMREQNKEFDRLREELDEARAQKDDARAKEIQRTLGSSQTVLRKTVSKSFFEAAKNSGDPEVTKLMAEACQEGDDMDMAMMNLMQDTRASYNDIEFDKATRAAIDAEMKQLKITDPKARASYEKYRKGLHQTWCRASELVSPAPPGHFLREFGQSDRDVIENANYEASVPQALTIMNSSTTAQVVHPWSALSLTLGRQANTADKIDALFMTLFTRKATKDEKTAILLSLDDAGPDSKTFWEDLTLASLSTQQFLFIR